MKSVLVMAILFSCYSCALVPASVTGNGLEKFGTVRYLVVNQYAVSGDGEVKKNHELIPYVQGSTISCFSDHSAKDVVTVPWDRGEEAIRLLSFREDRIYSYRAGIVVVEKVSCSGDTLWTLITGRSHLFLSFKLPP
jgi:hypothetical protein